MSNSIALLALEAADGTVVLTSITLVFAMLVALHLDRHAARHSAGHPVRGHPSPGQFRDADRHASAAQRRR